MGSDDTPEFTFDSLIEFNAHVQSERVGWHPTVESEYTESYSSIAAIISKYGEMAVVALLALAQDCIVNPDSSVT